MLTALIEMSIYRCSWMLDGLVSSHPKTAASWVSPANMHILKNILKKVLRIGTQVLIFFLATSSRSISHLQQGSLTERGRLSTANLLVPSSLYQLLICKEYIIYICSKISHRDEEVKCTEPSLSVSFPWLKDELSMKINFQVPKL